ncbi:MAG: hypothetical protein IKD10_13125 [Lentisphaeria bacterium]|nr:hypothetical protein [Lentisphaerota bacterium]MBR7145863.1 hypothetical protein [Lentisphaeria bacterium]
MKKIFTLLFSYAAIAVSAGSFTLNPDGTVLLNGGNANRVVGKVVPSQMPAGRGEIKGNIVFTVDIAPGDVEKVYAVSPDFEGQKSVDFKAPGNAIEVTVPGNMLKTFTEIRIKLKK